MNEEHLKQLIAFYDKEIKNLRWVLDHKDDGMGLIANTIAQCKVSDLLEKILLAEQKLKMKKHYFLFSTRQVIKETIKKEIKKIKKEHGNKYEEFDLIVSLTCKECEKIINKEN